MEMKQTDLVSILSSELAKQAKEFTEIGRVFLVGDGVCQVHGLISALYGELIEFEGGNKGIIFSLDEDFVSIFLLDKNTPLKCQLVLNYWVG
jgi:F-type H+-transporting ATPase subunit alpha